MARLPIDAEEIIAKFGPSLHMPDREGLPGRRTRYHCGDSLLFL